jgi:ABC-2 type transport system ATP-binding protein
MRRTFIIGGAMLEVVELTKEYRRRAVVDRVNFSIRPGEVLGYLGPNGSGKSTTVRMLVGILDPSSGEVRYRGHCIREDLLAYKARLGYVPEEPFLYPYLTGREYLQLCGRLRGLPEKAMNERIDALLEILRLYGDRHSAISSYSKGMKQKILISAAILHNPEIILFDEPLSGLDVTAALILRNLVAGLARTGKAILYSSHVLEVVEKVCTRVVILRRGKVVAHDSVDRLRSMLALPSLEDVFSQLAAQEDPQEAAGELLKVIQG